LDSRTHSAATARCRRSSTSSRHSTQSSTHARLSRNAHVPHQQVERAICGLLRACIEALRATLASVRAASTRRQTTHEDAVLLPLLALLCEAVKAYFGVSRRAAMRQAKRLRRTASCRAPTCRAKLVSGAVYSTGNERSQRRGAECCRLMRRTARRRGEAREQDRGAGDVERR
jgi:hypothetical protein